MIEAVPLSSKYDGRHKAHVESVLRKARQKISGSSPRKAEVLLYVWDSGGQIVFLDVLPAFLTSRTLFFLVFNSSVELSKKLLAVTRCKGVITSTQEYHLSTLEILLQWMASIHSHLGPHSEDGIMRPYPKVLLVSTHHDHLSCSEEQASIAQSLQSQYENKSYADLLMPSLPLCTLEILFQWIHSHLGPHSEDGIMRLQISYWLALITTKPALHSHCNHSMKTRALCRPSDAFPSVLRWQHKGREREQGHNVQGAPRMCASFCTTVHTPVSWVLFCTLVVMISQESNKPAMFYEEALLIADACQLKLFQAFSTSITNWE